MENEQDRREGHCKRYEVRSGKYEVKVSGFAGGGIPGRVGVVPSGCQPVFRLRRAAGTRNSESRGDGSSVAQSVSSGYKSKNSQSPERSEWAAGDAESPCTPASAVSSDNVLLRRSR